MTQEGFLVALRYNDGKLRTLFTWMERELRIQASGVQPESAT